MEKKPLHVLFFSESPVYGGAEEYVYQTARALGNGKFVFTFLHEDRSDLGGFLARLEEAGVRTVSMRKIRGKWDLGGFLRHVQRFRRLSPDIVHFNQSNPYSQQYSVIAARCAGLRNLVAIYHLTPGQPTRSRRGRCLERFIVSLLRRVLVLSRQNGEEMCAAFPASRGKIEIVQNGLEDPGRPDARVARQLRERLGLGAGKIIIAAAGRLTPQKGFETLLDAAALLERRDIAVVIAGEGPLRRTLEEEARRSGLNGTIVFPGFLEGAGTLFGASDLVAIPSLYEGQPFVLLEAMAAGKAVVASDMYGIREAVVQGETGMLVRPGSAEELARALSRLIDDPALRRAMGERARRRYEEHYTAREFRERMEMLYSSLAEGAR